MHFSDEDFEYKLIQLEQHISTSAKKAEGLAAALQGDLINAFREYRALCSDLEDLEKEYEELCRSIVTSASALGIKISPHEDGLLPLPEVKAHIDAIRKRRMLLSEAEEKKAKVRAYLERARSITALREDDEIQKSLELVRKSCDECQAVLERLSKEFIKEINEILEHMERCDHPIAALIRLVDSPEEGRTKTEEEALFESVKNKFGYILAAEAIRGQLRFAETAPEIRELPEPAPNLMPTTQPDGYEHIEKIDNEPAVSLEEDLLLSETETTHPEGSPSTLVEEIEASEETPVSLEDVVEEPETALDKTDYESIGTASIDIALGISQEADVETIAEIEHLFLQETVEEAATIVRQYKDDLYAQGITDIVLKLLAAGRHAESYWLARAAAAEGLDIEYPDWISIALTLLPYFAGQSAGIADMLRDCYERYGGLPTDGGNQNKDTAISMLVCSAALKPALVAPHMGTSGLLRSLRHLPPALFELSERAAECSDRGLTFYPNFLAMLRDDFDWQEQINNVCQRATQWLEEAKKKTILFQKATKLFHYWLNPGQPLHALLHPVAENDPSRIHVVKGLVEEFKDEKCLDKMMDSSLRDMKYPRRVTIEARARRQFISYVYQATEIARDWLTLLESQDARRDMGMVASARRELNRILKLLKEASETLSEIDNPESLWLSAAKEVCLFAFDDLRRYLEYSEYAHVTEANPFSILRQPLLLMRAWGRGNPQPSGVEWTPLTHQLLENLSSTLLDTHEAFDNLLERGRLDLAIELLESIEQGDASAGESLRISLENRKKTLRSEIQKNIDAVQAEVEKALLNDVITEEERTRFLSDIESMQHADIWDFEEAGRTLDSIRSEIEEGRSKLREEVKARVAGLNVSEEDRELVCKTLDSGEFSVAYEQLELLEKGQAVHALEPFEVKNRFEFFDAIQHLENVLLKAESGVGTKALLSPIRHKASFGSIDLQRLTGANVREAEKLIDVWFDLKRKPTSDILVLLKEILSRIGFNIKTLDSARTISRDRRTFFLETDTIPTSPVHQFGSSSEGRFFLLCLWDRPAEKDILNIIRDYCQNRPTIVFYFGRLSRHSRENMLLLATRDNPLFLILDDVVLLYLCTVRGDRGDAFFRSTLPLLGANPFLPEARANVPPELFVGREAEMASILDPRGSSFIFGGRQFGKSALLRNAMRAFHSPEDGRIAIYLDLKAEGIGRDRPLGEIWSLISEALRKNRIIPPSSSKLSNRNKIFEYIVGWLSGSPERRILLMLDEADEFLFQDSQMTAGGRDIGFVNVSALKGWQDETSGRFKLVFAGLHNVQRFWRIPNQPLAHLGFPLSIGPLKPRDAIKLITRPFEALGFRFGDHNAVIKILSHTNYQPLMLQIFCDRLFKHMMEGVKAGRVAGLPPFTISVDDVDAVYNIQDLRKVIKERFELTLQLDPWYELLAYVFAYHHVFGGLDHRGLSVADVEKEVRDWWEKGMEKAPHDWIAGLLDEMIGLGLLDRDETNRYRLRSPNVVRLLGNQEEIERVLSSFTDREVEIEKELSVTRRRLGADISRRSPFTLSQEARIFENSNGVIVVAGSKALGIDDVFESLNECTFTGDTERRLRSIESMDEESDIDSILDEDLRRGSPGLYIFILQNLLKKKAAMADMIELSNSRKYSQKYFKLLFCYDALPFTQWVRENQSAGIMDLQERGLNLLLLRPWDDNMLKRLCWELELNVTKENVSEILRITGGFPLYAHRFFNMLQENDGNVADALQELEHSLFGSSQAISTLADTCGITCLWPSALMCLKAAIEYGAPLSFEELRYLCTGEGTMEADIENALFCLGGLSLLLVDNNGNLQPNPVVAYLAREQRLL